MPIEIKSGQTLNRDFFSGLRRWTTLAGDLVIEPTLVYGGTSAIRHMGTRVLPWFSAGEVFSGDGHLEEKPSLTRI